MRYADTSAYMPLGQAVELAISREATEAQARDFVKDALEDRALEYRHGHPPAGAEAVRLDLSEEIDWPTSVVTVLVRYGARFGEKGEVLEWCRGPLVPWRTRIEVHREQLLTLIDRAARSQPELQPVHEAPRQLNERPKPPSHAQGSFSRPKVQKWFRAHIDEAIAKGGRLTCADVVRAAKTELGPGLRDLIRDLWKDPRGPVPGAWHNRGPRAVKIG